MSNPLLNNLSDLSDEDLEKKMQELNSKFYMARAAGVPEEVLYQLNFYHDSFSEEKERRHSSEVEKTGVIIETDPISEKDIDDHGQNQFPPRNTTSRSRRN